MLFEDLPTLARTLVAAPLAYVALLVVIRVSGKRALAKLNAFDLVVTVALGSVLASVAVAPDVTLASGAAVFALLVAFQYVIAFLSARAGWAQRLVKAQPTLLVRDGALREEALDRQRVAHSEVLQVLRQHGLASLDEAAAVVLETDGTMSVLERSPPPTENSTLRDVPDRSA